VPNHHTDRRTAFVPPLIGEGPQPLEGEDIGTALWEDAHHWMTIYADLIEFNIGILDRVRRDVAKLPPAARMAAQADIRVIESQMEGYQRRIEIWSRRVWDLHGLRLDPKSRIIRYRGEKATLTVREFQFLRFLLDHPRRYFTATQILGQAWADPGLFPEEVRNHVRRVRKLLAALEIPCDLVSRPGRGYSLLLRVDV
jgi:hypothetical protein